MKQSVLIAFDFDGVIADTVSMLKGVFSAFLSEYHISYSNELFERFNGVTLAEMIASVKEQYHIERSNEDLLSSYKKLIRTHTSTIQPIPGIKDTLKILKERGYTIVVSSSASRDYIEDFLSKHHLSIYFDEVFSGNSFSCTKPDKRYYLSITEKFKGLKTFIVEDSDNGLVSAFNSGNYAIYFNKDNRKAHVPYHFSIKNISQIIDVIESNTKKGFFIPYDDIDIVIKDTHPVFNDSEYESIEKRWNERPKHVFNGNVIAFNKCYYRDKKMIAECYLTEYKYVYSIRGRITPVAVSGICLDPDNNTIVSVRNKVTDYSGSYELIPSGGIQEDYVENDSKGYKRQIITEFLEEAGPNMSENNIIGVDTLGLCFDASSNTIDICMRIRYADKFIGLNLEAKNEEYSFKTTLIDSMENVRLLLKEKNAVLTSQMILDNVQ